MDMSSAATVKNGSDLAKSQTFDKSVCKCIIENPEFTT